MIHKYDSSFQYSGDDVKIKSPNIYILDGVMPNYGSAKSKKERNETYERRKKAWDNGVTLKNHGSHYRVGKEIGWIWNKKKLSDIRKTEYYKFIKNANFYK